MNHSEMILEFNLIKNMLADNAVSEAAKEQLLKLVPYLNEGECKAKMEETTEAKKIMESTGTPPLSAMKEIQKIIILCEKGAMLIPEQLECVSLFIASCQRMKAYLKKAEYQNVGIAYYGQSIYDLTDLQQQIIQSIQNGTVSSSANNELKNIRRKMEQISVQIKKKLDDLLRSKKNYFSDSYVSQRNGRYVVPVKKEYKNQISGTVIETSSTGGTYFIEPSAVSKLQDEKNNLSIEEDNEIRKILYMLTGLVEDSIYEIKLNMEAMTTLDVLFAKAKLSIEMKAIPVEVNTERSILIEKGRHPLLNKQECVPLDFSIGENIRGVVITGPNTGGKTVTLKTVGLLSMMAQSGLHVPVKSGKFCMNNLILTDIGDGQSITENLSTFSAHITNIIKILELSNQESLVLLDELGSGTDPAEGMGIAVAILEELRIKGCLFIATTHYPEVKEYAEKAPNLINARMAFDSESLRPLYQLEIGEAGESCALYIAKRLGFPEHMLKRAHQAAYRTNHASAKLDIDFEDTKPNEELINILRPSIQKKQLPKKENSRGKEFQIGDSVVINPEKKLGIVFKTLNEKGEIGIQIKGVKTLINYKRLELKASASELYPPDYDFSIIFDSVENRKAHHQMERKYIPGLTIEINEP